MVSNDLKCTRLIYDPDVSVRRDLSTLRMLVVDGPDTGRACTVGMNAICVGSDPAADLVLVDETVSRRHLLARREGEGVWVQDQRSTNGTFFEGSRIMEIIVGPGSTLRVGKTLLKVVPQEKNLHPEPASDPHYFGVLGISRRMREIFATASEVAPTELTVLIEGETGTGKEALAEAIHRASPRKERPLVVVDCTTVPRELVESELFGHSRGAFTGAVADRTGCFVQANGGTVFIDEVGDLPPELQPKLLRVLERHQLKPVGSARSIDVDIRVIAATHKDLREELAAGRFREDLYYRLAVIAVRIPPLRERTEDLPLLMAHFVRQASKGRLDPNIPSSALLRFQGYPWPGNVRELRNVVERALALQRSEKFELESFLAEITRGLGETSARSGSASSGSPRPLPFKQAKSQVVEDFERAYLTDLMQRHDGNVSKASREARLDRHHLTDLFKKHGIKAK